jgi:hypothetical protein
MIGRLDFRKEREGTGMGETQTDHLFIDDLFQSFQITCVWDMHCASLTRILPKTKMKERKPIPKTNVAAITPIKTIFIFSPPSLFLTKSNKKPVVSMCHGFAKFLLLRQPGCPGGTRGFPSSDYPEFGFFGYLFDDLYYIKSKFNAKLNLLI